MLNRTIDRLPSHNLGAMAVAAAALITCGGAAHGQSCLLNESQLLPAPTPPLNNSQEFGSVLAAEGDRALCSALLGPLTNQAGTVYALQRNAGVWSVAQTITSPDASNSDQFGSSLAISGDWAIMGAPQEDPSAVFNCGAAYLYSWNGSAWVYHSRITPTDLVANKQFGRVVDIDGTVAVASAVGDIEGGNASAGAAYVFRYNGSAWVQEQKLMEASPAAGRRFGTAVAIDDGTILVSAVPSGTPGATSGVHVYQHNGTVWQSMQIVQSPAFPAIEDFGVTMRIDGSTFAASAAPPAPPGQVRIFTFNGAQWAHQQTIAGSAQPGSPDGPFGRAFDLQGDRIIVGAPQRTAFTYLNDTPSPNAGLGFMFERSAGTWSLLWTTRTHPRLNAGTFYHNQNDHLGMSAAFAGDQYLLGATTPNSSSVEEYGYVAVYPTQPADCDSDSVADACETDCNANNLADVCEIMNNPALDCDLNGQLDVCQQPAEFVVDNGLAWAVWGSFFQEIDMIWLTQHRVVAGGQRITHIALPWTLYTTPGLPYTVLIYDDPNNDGDPADAVLLTTAQAFAPDPPGGISMAAVFTIVPVPTTLVGDIGESFFVGAAMHLPFENGGAAESTLNNTPGRSWRGSSPPGQIDINTPSANPNFVSTTRRLMVRAYGLDCNGNGEPDSCDIDSGFSLDLNSNGVPDECDDTCPANTSIADNEVNINDLLDVINNWGACANCPPEHCAADVDPVGPPQGDCQININDLLAVINAWGACP